MKVVKLGDPGSTVLYETYKCKGCFSLLQVLCKDMRLVPLETHDALAESSDSAAQKPEDDHANLCCESADVSDEENSELNGAASQDNGTADAGSVKLKGSGPNGAIDWSESVDDDDEAPPLLDLVPVHRNYAQVAARAGAKKAVFTCCVCSNICRAHDKFIDVIEQHLKFVERRARYQKKREKMAQQKKKGSRTVPAKHQNGVATTAKHN